MPFLHDHEGEERAIWWRGSVSELRGSGFDCLHLPLEDPGELALAHSVPVENDDLRVCSCIQRNIIIFVFGRQMEPGCQEERTRLPGSGTKELWTL